MWKLNEGEIIVHKSLWKLLEYPIFVARYINSYINVYYCQCICIEYVENSINIKGFDSLYKHIHSLMWLYMFLWGILVLQLKPNYTVLSWELCFVYGCNLVAVCWCRIVCCYFAASKWNMRETEDTQQCLM